MFRRPIAVALALAAGLLAHPSALGAAERRVTELVTARCKVVHVATEDEAGEKLARRDRYADGWRCGGLDGRQVFVSYADQREGIAFGRRGREATDYLWHDHFGSWGPEVEWRGPVVRGRLAPVAAIVRYGWDIANGGDKGADLAVIRLGAGAAASCIMALVDTVANADAAEIARRTADDLAAKHVCEKGAEPQRLGRTRETPAE